LTSGTARGDDTSTDLSPEPTVSRLDVPARSACAHLAFAAAALLLPLRPAAAQLTADAASKIVDGCRAHARAKQQSHAIVVVDAGGHPIALLRMDGNAPGVGEFALKKAEAVAAWRFSTADMVAAARDTPGFATAPHVVTVAGGVPVYSADGRDFLGAVGVSGEAAADDAACAEAGIRSAGLQPAPRRPGGGGS
jgi:glc operon protein GlcG